MTTEQATSVIAAVISSNEQGIPEAVWSLVKAAGCVSTNREWEAFLSRKTNRKPKELYLEEQINILTTLGREWKWDAVDSTFGAIYGMLKADKPTGNNGFLWHQGNHPVQTAL